MLPIYVLAWIPMVFIAILNGMLREFTYGKSLPEMRAHQISTIIAIVLFGIYIWILTGIWRIEAIDQAIAIGFIWLVMTVAFEFLFGHYAAGHSWQRLLNDYNLLAGRLWSLVLVWIITAPILFYYLRSRS
jgi:hypothetical protein